MLTQESPFSGKVLLVGFGSIGQGVLPLLLKHLQLAPTRVSIVAADDHGAAVAQEYGVRLSVIRLDAGNYRQVLTPLLQEGDFLINVSNDVSSYALIELCQRLGVMYVDTCIEPWAGGYTDEHASPQQRSNYALREQVLALRRDFRHGPTAVLTHGANPGLVSHFVKRALLDLAQAGHQHHPRPTDRAQWAQLARHLGVRVIHIAERDFQETGTRKCPGEFVNTWSVEGFVGEGCQPAELGWGSHEQHFPADGLRHPHGCAAAIYLNRPGAATRVRSWTPQAGPYHGFLITHGEAISIADYFTVGQGEHPEYRPTVHYAYHPCDDAVLSLHELAGNNWQLQPGVRLVKEEIHSGFDELGVLLMGHVWGGYWFGSRLSIDEARRMAPHNGATSLQVTAPVVAAVLWALSHPHEGIVEPEDLPFDDILDFCGPYLGELIGVYTDWTPLQGRNRIFQEDIDPADPWQFKNFRV
ncbi:saccharopine dehydrogenase NADP-binding domain-containing protein [Chitiniphilus purpureus]|uniref:Saccharopine dehydrogenase NADP-binding domain-containing protein n=1 Tax=Chitiniphilus purpureus TaxID=2981137 RepID=A0ABY6DQW0_9NEIS|nr:saccharopine dehydrogenase NADP-binding domain-containing protein [Chitiniphilus sp. CD1]UXY15471.1 saccharopine dehydrogenase NADP-binding domain-containing protein [Chitiniphilus sp. CD1]